MPAGSPAHAGIDRGLSTGLASLDWWCWFPRPRGDRPIPQTQVNT